MYVYYIIFVLLYSMSSPDPVKMAQLKEAMAEKVGMSSEASMQSQSAIEKNLQEIIEQLEIGGETEITRDTRGVALEVNGSLCFASEKAILSEDLKNILKQVKDQILNNAEDHRHVLVEGHSDSAPLKPKETDYYFGVIPTNFHLSSARASEVVNYLIEIGVNSGKLQPSGYADRWPSGATWHEVSSGKVDNQFILDRNSAEKYVDSNNNGKWDNNEAYTDLNKNEKYDTAEDNKTNNRRIKIVFTNQ